MSRPAAPARARIVIVAALVGATTIAGTVLAGASAQGAPASSSNRSQTVSVTVRAERDTTLDRHHPGRRFGSAHHLQAGHGKLGLVEFALSDEPAGTILRDATLCLVPTHRSRGHLVVSTAAAGWSERTTWRSRPAGAGHRLAKSHGRLRAWHRSCVRIPRSALTASVVDLRLSATRRTVTTASREDKRHAPTLTVRYTRAAPQPEPSAPATATPTTAAPTTAAPTTDAPTTAAPTTAAPTTDAPTTAAPTTAAPTTAAPTTVAPTTAAPTTAVPTTAVPQPTPTDTPVQVPTGLDHLVVDSAALRTLPMAGTGWVNLLKTATGSTGSVDLANQDNTNAGRVFANALVYARTGLPAYRDTVVANLADVNASTLPNARVLSVARQIAGYAMAADLVDYHDPAFVSFMSGIRTRYIGNHGRFVALSQTSEDTANNWGAWALTSRIAVDVYLHDQPDLARSAQVFRGFLGDRSAYAGFKHTTDFDPTYQCGSATAWVPINPVGCGDKDGAIVEDISRSEGAWPAIDDTGRTYSWETLGAAMMSAKMLAGHGYPGVYGWSDQALLRAAKFEQRHGGYAPLYTNNQLVPWMVNKAYDVSMGPLNPAGYGRQFGFTDWLP